MQCGVIPSHQGREIVRNGVTVARGGVGGGCDSTSLGGVGLGSRRDSLLCATVKACWAVTGTAYRRSFRMSAAEKDRQLPSEWEGSLGSWMVAWLVDGFWPTDTKHSLVLSVTEFDMGAWNMPNRKEVYRPNVYAKDVFITFSDTLAKLRSL